jgi:hypothetical protein
LSIRKGDVAVSTAARIARQSWERQREIIAALRAGKKASAVMGAVDRERRPAEAPLQRALPPAQDPDDEMRRLYEVLNTTVLAWTAQDSVGLKAKIDRYTLVMNALATALELAAAPAAAPDSWRPPPPSAHECKAGPTAVTKVAAKATPVSNGVEERRP